MGNILVTGGVGFIGVNLIKRLVKEGHEVYGTIHKNKKEVKGVEYFYGDLRDMEFSNRPFSWGWSSGNSPILSAKAVPFNRFSLYKKIGNFNFEYFHRDVCLVFLIVIPNCLYNPFESIVVDILFI